MFVYNDLEKLSSHYGDSFYLLDEQKLKSNFFDFLVAFRAIYPNTEIAYSYKTNYIPALCKKIHSYGGKAEVVSEMEYSMARKNKVKPCNIYYNGPYKKHPIMGKILKKGSHVNLDNYEELDFVEKIAQKSKQPLSIGIRCNYDIGTGKTSRFGVDVTDPLFFKRIEQIHSNKKLTLTGIHAHFPDRPLSVFEKKADGMKKLLLQLKEKSLLENIQYVSFGGGFYGKPTKQLESIATNQTPNFSDYAKVIGSVMNELFKNSKKQPTLILEPGTAIVADTIQLVTRVVAIKKIRDKHFATVSGSSYNMNPSVKNINRPISLYSPLLKQSEKVYDVVGYTCIEDDIVYHGYQGSLNVGDFFVFHNVGSYSVVFKPPFILPNVPILMYEKKRWKLIKRAETVEDILKSYK